MKSLLLLLLALLSMPGVATAQATTFADGVHVVGIDIAPGTYQAPGGDSCYWARLSGLGGTADDIIASENVSGPAHVTVEVGDAGLEVHGCGEWTSLEAPQLSDPPFDAAAAEAAVFRELWTTDTTLDVGFRSFVNRWNEAVRGHGRRYRIETRPTMRLDDQAGMRYYEVVPAITARGDGSSTVVRLRAYLQPDDRIRTAGLLWLPRAASPPDVEADRLDAMLLMDAFVRAANPRLQAGHDLMARLGWPPADQGLTSFEGFGESVVQEASDGVVYLLTAFPDEEGRQMVWLTARRGATSDP